MKYLLMIAHSECVLTGALGTPKALSHLATHDNDAVLQHGPNLVSVSSKRRKKFSELTRSPEIELLKIAGGSRGRWGRGSVSPETRTGVKYGEGW